MANILNVNTDDLVVLSNKLEKIGRAELPVAVRSTLNNMAFRMKGAGGKRGAIDVQAEKDFDFRRNKHLFKAMTGVSKASGLNIKNMKSESGIIKRSGKTELAEGLADQQTGGSTKQSATPLSGSRTGRNVGKKVRRPAYLKKLNSIDLRNKKGNKFIGGAIRAYKSKRTIIVSGRGSTIIARVRRVRKGRGSIDIQLQGLYKLNKSGEVKLKKATPFISRAATNVMKDLPKEFKIQAERRITKALKK